MLKLFSVYLGGRTAKSNIELHDVVFVVSDSIKHAYPALINKWFGETKQLHIDSYIELSYADGFDITLGKEKSADKNKLFYVNFGAYKQDHFGEIHESSFYVGANKQEVLARAKKELCVKGIKSHCDDTITLDDMIEIDHIDHYFLHFSPTTRKKLNIISDYLRLDLPEILQQATSSSKAI